MALLMEIDRGLDVAQWKREPSPPEAAHAYNAKTGEWIVRVVKVRRAQSEWEYFGVALRRGLLLSLPCELAEEWFVLAEGSMTPIERRPN